MYIVSYDFWLNDSLVHHVGISSNPNPPKDLTCLKNFKAELIS